MLGERFSRLLEETVWWVATLFFVLFCVAILLQVFTRYVLNNPLPWSEEAARYLSMWAMFLGAVTVTSRRSHLCVDLIDHYLDRAPKRLRIAYRLVIDLAVALALPGLIYGSFFMAYDRWGVRLVTLPLPHGLAFLSLAVSSVLMLLYTVDHIVTDIKELMVKEGK